MAKRVNQVSTVGEELSKFVITQIPDIDRLVYLIKRNKGCSKILFEKFISDAKQSRTPDRILTLLKRRVLPLILKYEDIKRLELKENNVNEERIYINNIKEARIASLSKYKASDFKFSDGVITCGKYSLKSVRIKKVKAGRLGKINRDFKIRATPDMEFTFVPPTDLTVFLELLGQNDYSPAVNNGIRVQIKDFSFQPATREHSSHLVYKGRYCDFEGDIKWFNRDVLSSLNDEFIVFLDGNNRFLFKNNGDSYILASKLCKAYRHSEEVKKIQAKREIFEEIEQKIEYLKNEIIHSFNIFDITLPIHKFYRNDITQMYEIEVDVREYLDTSEERRRIDITVEQIMQMSSSRFVSFYKNEIADKYPNGFSYVVSFDEINKYMSSYCLVGVKNMLKCKIPIIVVERYHNIKNFRYRVYALKNNIDPGYYYIYYKSVLQISEFTPLLQKKRYAFIEDSLFSFSSESKSSIKKIICETHGYMSFVFGSAYSMLSNDMDVELLDYHRKYMCDIPIYSSKYAGNYNLTFGGGISPLLDVNIYDVEEWMWLISEIRRGRFNKAYKFFDLDNIYSNDNSIMKRAYICVEFHDAKSGFNLHDAGCSIYLYEFDIKKKTYCFKVKKDYFEIALFAIWAYFSSTCCNKRENISDFLNVSKMFGIETFYKCPSLSFLRGVGYFETKWLD